MLPDQSRLRDSVRGFAHRLRGMTKLKGWRLKDRLIILATLTIHLILSAPRLLLHFYSPPNSERREWVRRLDLLGYSTFLDCVVVSNDGLFRLRHGVEYLLIPDYHEPLAWSVFQPTEGEVVVDVGAFIGFYTMRASRLVGSRGKVVAVEAEPSNFEALLFNLKLNQANNVIPLNLAAWDKEAMLDLHIFQENLALNSLTHLHGNSAKSIKVKARPLDAVLEELGVEKVDWVKIDVEGAEVEVLQGMEKTISHSPNLRLLVELHSDETIEKCLSMLTEKGYEVKRVAWHIFAVPVA